VKCGVFGGRKTQTFEDVELSEVKLRRNMINLLHMWMVTHHQVDVPTLADFMNLFYSSPYYGLILIYFMSTKVAPLYALLMILKLLIKKKKIFFSLMKS
jgi:hypothetical protein